MNAEDTRTIPPEGDFDPHRLRSITDMERSKDDRLLGGVCSGAAKYLNVDPVIVRVVVAVLTVVGFAGVILYAAAWFLLPAEGEGKSVAADWFKLDKNEEQVRVAGLVGAGVLALLAIVGDNGYAWWGVPWLLVPAAFVYYLFAVRPRRRRLAETALAAQVAPPGVDPADESARGPEFSSAKAGLVTDQKAAKSRRPRSWALTWLTLSLVAIAVAATRIHADFNGGTPWTTYVAVALGVVAVGLLVGTLFGNGGPLIGIGALLAIALAVGSVLPSGRIGEEQQLPLDAGQVQATYKHGIGILELDLTAVTDSDALLGRRIEVRAGIGETRIIIPDGLNVELESHLDAGQIIIFDRQAEGTGNELAYPADSGPALTIDIHQRIGNIEVIRQ